MGRVVSDPCAGIIWVVTWAADPLGGDKQIFIVEGLPKYDCTGLPAITRRLGR